VVLLHAFPSPRPCGRGRWRPCAGSSACGLRLPGPRAEPGGDGLYTLDLFVTTSWGDGRAGDGAGGLVGLSMGATWRSGPSSGRRTALRPCACRHAERGRRERGEGAPRRLHAVRGRARVRGLRADLPAHGARAGTLASRPAVADRVRRMVEGNPPLGIRGRCWPWRPGGRDKYLSMTHSRLVIVGSTTPSPRPPGRGPWPKPSRGRAWR